MKKIIIPLILLLLMSFSVLGALNDATHYWSLDTADGGLNPEDLASTNDGTAQSTTATDSSGYINQGILYSNAGQTAFTPIPMNTFASGFTYAFWIKTTDTDGEHFVLGQSVFSLSQEGFAFRYAGTDGKLDFLFVDNGGREGYSVDSSSAVNDGDWHSVIATWEGSTNDFKVYTDNVLTKSIPTSAGAGATLSQDLYIGNSYSGGNSFDGSIDEVGIYDYAFTSAQRTEFHSMTSNPYPASSIINDLPIDNYHDNNQTIYFKANTTGLSGSCELFLNSTSYGNATINSDVVSKGVTPLENSDYTWFYQCGDTFSNTNTTFVYDTINPLYYEYTLNTDNTTLYKKNNGENYEVTFLGNTTDTYLFAFNYTIFDDNNNVIFTNSTTGLTSQEEEIKHTLDIGSWKRGTYTQNITISDDHTAKWIPDNMDFVISTKAMEILTDDVTFMIESANGNLKSATFEYATDRYNFGFEKQTATNEWDFNLFCDDTLYYRGDLYEYPVFVCGTKWIDFNIVGSAPIETIVKELSNGAYNINFKFAQASSNIDFNSVGGLNIVTYSYTFDVENNPDISLISYKAFNSTNGEVTSGFKTDNLIEIETSQLSYIINSHGTPLSEWYLNFTGNGSDACATGNRQNGLCYSYNNETHKWIKFVNDTITSTYNGKDGNMGDSIIPTIHKYNSSYWELNISIDEHFNPNIMKSYDVKYNYSDVLYQSDPSKRITKNNEIKIINPSGFMSLEADQYKLDFRVQVGGNPTQPLNAYFCNSTYVSGSAEVSPNCEIVSSLLPSQLDGTKYRSIYTKEIFNSIGTPTQLILDTDENNNNNYYALKTMKRLNTSIDVRTAYSTNKGATWFDATDDYESEANTNWFIDGLNPTSFVTSLSVSTASTSNTLLNTHSWNITPNTLYAPLVSINDPLNGELLNNATFPYTIRFNVNDFNDDALNVSLFLNNTLLSDTLREFDSEYILNSLDEGNYSLTLYAEKTSNNSYNSTITSLFNVYEGSLTPTLINIYSPFGDYTLNSSEQTFLFNYSSAGSNITYTISLLRNVLNYPILTTNELFFYKNLTKLDVPLTGNYSIKVIATNEIGSNTTISANTLNICINNWVAQYTTCTNSTQVVTYYDSNSCLDSYDIPLNNGTSISCDDGIKTEEEIQVLKMMLIIIFVAFCLLMLIQLLRLNPMLSISAGILNILIAISFFYLLEVDYTIVPISMLIFQGVVLMFNIKYIRE